jgi:hypothetical protein
VRPSVVFQAGEDGRWEPGEGADGVAACVPEGAGTPVGPSVDDDEQVWWGGEPGDGDAPGRVGEIPVGGEGQRCEPGRLVVIERGGQVVPDLVELAGTQDGSAVDEQQQGGGVCSHLQPRGNPRVCQLLDVGLVPDAYWIVMPQYRCSLAQWRASPQQRPPSEPCATALYLAILTQVRLVLS